MQWTFQTTFQRFDVGNNEEVWQHIVIPSQWRVKSVQAV